ncbi:MAG: hypothetical protein ACU4F9_01790 [Arcticibacter sp.]
MDENTTPPVKEKTPWLGFIIMAVIVIVMFKMCSSCGDDTSTSSKKETKDETITLTADQLSILFDVENDGHVEFKESKNEIWVKPLFWNVCDFQAKTNLTYLSAIRCGNARGSTDYSCTVYDMMTGKKLAKWDELWGFEMEE